MTVVVGTAGHIDHGKTTLLRALTGMEADRLPEEQRRGLTIDVGYAHGAPDDGPEIDYVDVPGHDRLVGNMLVGVGEIDAALIVVAADDGPRAQTWEHLGLLDAMGIGDAVVAITKVDVVASERVAYVGVEMARALDATVLAGSPVVGVSAVSGAGIRQLRTVLADLRDRVTPRRHPGPWLSVDRAFGVHGHGVVVTGSSRGSPIRAGDSLRLRPGDPEVRVRGVHVHDQPADASPAGGRVALNVSGLDLAEIQRGQLLTSVERSDEAAPVDSDRFLVVLRAPAALPGRRERDRWPPADASTARLHIGTDSAEAVLGRSGRDDLRLKDGRCVAVARTERPVVVAAGERFLLRRPPPAGLLAAGLVIDPAPPRGRARHRQTAERVTALVEAVDAGGVDGIAAARLDLHGMVGVELAPDLDAAARVAARSAVIEHHRVAPDSPGLPLSAVRAAAMSRVRPELAVGADVERAVELAIDAMLTDGLLDRHGERIHVPDHSPAAPDPAIAAAQDSLVRALDVSGPPSLSTAAAAADCPPAGVRALERDGRIVLVADDLAWSGEAFDRLRAQALTLAGQAPLTPAAFRDATGTSRKYVMALLEDLDRRGILRRTPAGHLPGPRAQEKR